MERTSFILSIIHYHHPHLTFVPILPSLISLICRTTSEPNLSLSQSLSIVDLHTRPLTSRKEWNYFPTNQRDSTIFVSVFKELLHSLIPELGVGGDASEGGGGGGGCSDTVLDWNRFLFTFFEGILEVNQSMEVFDSFLLEGYKIIFRFGLGIFVLKRKELLKDLNNLFEPLKCSFRHLKETSFREISLTSSEIRALVRRFSKTKGFSVASDANLSIMDHNRRMPVFSTKETRLTKQNQDWLRLIWGWIPERMACLSLRLLFCSQTDGRHLLNLLKRTLTMEPLLVLIETMEFARVGCYLSKSFDLATTAAPYGTGETFVFDSENPYRWTEENSSFIRVADGCVSVGVSEESPITSSLWFDLQLMKVGSGQGGTFSNKFSLFNSFKKEEIIKEIRSIEVFGFSF